MTCSGTAYSSFWVGLDGDTSNTVEQTGTDADCSGTTPQYYAWYEMYPKFPVNFSNPVKPGDHLSRVGHDERLRQLHADDLGQHPGVDQQTNARLKSAKLASAEVIAEAPSSSSGVLPLANFGTVELHRRQRERRPAHQQHPAHRPDHDASGSTVKAQPGSISTGAFSVAWKHS